MSEDELLTVHFVGTFKSLVPRGEIESERVVFLHSLRSYIEADGELTNFGEADSKDARIAQLEAEVAELRASDKDYRNCVTKLCQALEALRNLLHANECLQTSDPIYGKPILDAIGVRMNEARKALGDSQ